MKIRKILILYILFLFVFFIIESKIYDKFLYIDEVRILTDVLKLNQKNFSEMFYPHRIFSIFVFDLFLHFFENIYLLRLVGIFFSISSVLIFYKTLCLFFDEEKSFLGTLLFSSYPVFLGMGPTLLTDNIGLFWSISGIYFYFLYKKFNLTKNLVYSSLILSIGLMFKEIVLFTTIAIIFDMLKEKNTRSIFIFVFLFSLTPLVFLIAYWFLANKILWLDFYILNSQTFKWRHLTSLQYLKMILFYGNFIFFWGIYSLIKSKKDKNFEFFFIFFILNIMIFFLWPEVASRHFVFFLPSLVYFVLSFESNISKTTKNLFIIIPLLNYIFSLFFLLIFVQPYFTLTKTIDWIEVNIDKESTVFTNNYLLEFLLKFEKYNITNNYNEGKYIILEFDFPKNLTLLKEFKEKCYFSSIRTLNCDSFVIRIFYKH